MEENIKDKINFNIKKYINQSLLLEDINYSNLNKFQENILIKFTKKFNLDEKDIINLYNNKVFSSINEGNFENKKEELLVLDYNFTKNFLENNFNDFLKSLKNSKQKELLIDKISKNLNDLNLIDFDFIHSFSCEMSDIWFNLVLDEQIKIKHNNIQSYRFIQGIYKINTIEEENYLIKELERFRVKESNFSKKSYKKLKEMLLKDYSDEQIISFLKLNSLGFDIDNKLNYIENLIRNNININIIKDYISIDYEKYNIDIDNLHDLIISNSVEYVSKIKPVLENYLIEYDRKVQEISKKK